MTGRHPQRSGVSAWTQGNLKSKAGVNMALEEVTLAEALESAGYATALFGKWHLGANRDFGPTKQGFGTFFGHRGGFIDNYRHYFLHGKGFHDLYEGTNEVHAPGKYFPELAAVRAEKFMEQNRSNPFFLYYALNIPHYPEQALAQFADEYQDLPMPRRSYAAMVSTTDYYLGRILEKLTTLGLDENTIVLFISDNGHSAEHKTISVDDHTSGLPKGHYYSAHGGGGNTGKWIGHKSTFLEGGIRVPAIVRLPGMLVAGDVRNQAVTAMDWYPTILEMCQVAQPNVKLDGKSLVPVLKSAQARPPHDVIYFQWINNWAVLQGDWKLISGKQLVNLADLKPEQKNYATEEPEVVQRLQMFYDAWQQDLLARKAD